MKYFLFILSLLVFSACSNKLSKETTIYPEEICDCIDTQDQNNIDKALDNCLTPLNDFLTGLIRSGFDKTKIMQLSSSGMEGIISQLTKSCDSYRQSINETSKNQFISKNQEDAKNIIDKLNTDQQTSDTIAIAKAYLTIGNNAKAIRLQEAYLVGNPKSDLMYWMKAFSHSQTGQVQEASKTIEKAISEIENASMINYLKLYKNTLNPKIDYDQEGLRLNISRF